ncbi:MAG: nicotinate-nucleotide adenylyltransferase [Chloroflexi bacterium]|nr:nicotinate-nucleotide adenylyltransferase [Chloroflexota bacterium]
MKVGIMGGTFDPIHVAHLIVAEEARTRLALDRVIFIPAGNPWMKSEHMVSGAEHRVAMVKLAISSNPAFSLSLIEVERPGPTYTVDTLEGLLGELGYDTQLFLLLGWDSVAELTAWKAPCRISRMATVVAFPRPGFQAPDIAKLEKSMPGIAERIMVLDEPYLGVSSTGIRQRVAGGQSVRYLVPDAVCEYINRHKLYIA